MLKYFPTLSKVSYQQVFHIKSGELFFIKGHFKSFPQFSTP